MHDNIPVLRSQIIPGFSFIYAIALFLSADALPCDLPRILLKRYMSLPNPVEKYILVIAGHTWLLDP
jgi:hypothetical protein